MNLFDRDAAPKRTRWVIAAAVFALAIVVWAVSWAVTHAPVSELGFSALHFESERQQWAG